MQRRAFLIGSSMLVATAGAKAACGRSRIFFIGTQAATPGHGIVAASLDEGTGALELFPGVTEVAQPTWLLADPVRAVLYSVSEIGYSPGQAGEVLSFAIGLDGRLTLISRVSSGGGGPTFIGSDRSASTLWIAHYGDGKIAAIPVSADGTLSEPAAIAQAGGSGPHPRQNGPHAHAAVLDPSGRFVLVPDLGADRVFVYQFDPVKRSLIPASTPWLAMPPGSGPRHLVFAPDGRTAFLITELTATVHSLDWKSRSGVLTNVAATALDPGNFEGTRSGAEIAISADGRFIYASNRATNAIQVFGINQAKRTLQEIQTIASGGTRPWSFALSPCRGWMVVANQGSNQVTSFKVDRYTGKLLPASASLTVGKPVAVAFSNP